MSVLKMNNISYTYDGKKYVVKDLSYEFKEGYTYSIVGRSGSGKTTLLSILAGLKEPTSGDVIYKKTNLTKINKDKYRSKNIGIVFQSFNLLPHLTALENVVLSMDIAGIKVKNKENKALELLEKVGITEEKARRRVLKLSGGEQQRVTIARTLSYNPDIILADEPTGNLDKETENEILSIFENLAKKEKKCVIIVTHSREVAEFTDEILSLTKKKT